MTYYVTRSGTFTSTHSLTQARFPSKRNRLRWVRCVRCVWMETWLNASTCVGKQPIMVATTSTEHPIGCWTQRTQRTQRKRLRLDGNWASLNPLLSVTAIGATSIRDVRLLHDYWLRRASLFESCIMMTFRLSATCIIRCTGYWRLRMRQLSVLSCVFQVLTALYSLSSQSWFHLWRTYSFPV